MSILIHNILPIFAILLCGFIAKKGKHLPSASVQTLNLFVYYFALPAILFYSIATAPLEDISNRNFMYANAIIIVTGFLLAILLFRLFFKKRFPELSLYGMASSYGNTGFLGIPLLIAAFGQEALVPAAIATFMYDVLLITFVIVSFELRKKHQTPILKRLRKTICFNPINIALLLGILVAMLKIDVPLSVQVFCETLGNAAGPTALFALGFGLVRDKGIPMEKIKISELSIILSLKLFVQPILAFLLIRFAFPLEETWAIALIILSGLPTGAMAYVFAERYKTLYEQMPKWILATTISSLLTLTILLLFLVGI